jgi:transcriptional regulator with XRE-family HTH domain
MTGEPDAALEPQDRRTPVPPRQQVLKPIPDNVTPEVRQFTETLRGLFDSSETTLRRLAADMHFSAGNVSRYLSGQRPPPREFVEKLLRICYDTQGTPVTVEVAQLVSKQRLAALKSSRPALYKIELLNDQLAFALTEKRACDNTVLQLQREIDQWKNRIYDLESEKRQILAAWDDERQRSDEAMAEDRMERDETIRSLKRQVEQLNEQLDRALGRAEAAEERCRNLETQIDEASMLVEDVEDEMSFLARRQPAPATTPTAQARSTRPYDHDNAHSESHWETVSPTTGTTAHDNLIRIGLWGSPQSGKTTYLAALRHAANSVQSDYGQWSMVPLTEASSSLLVELSSALNRGHFPHATMTAGVIPLTWVFTGDITKSKFVSAGQRLLRRGRIRSEFVLDLVDVSGNAFSDNPESAFVPRASADAAIERLLSSHGVIYLFDPLGERENRDALEFVNRTIVELKRKYYQRTGRGGRLPHQVSICVTKFDHPDILHEASRNNLVHSGPDGTPRVRDEQAQQFFEALCTGRFWNKRYEEDDRSASFVMRELQNSFEPENIKYFVTSSIGFYRQPGWVREATSFDPNDFANYIAPSADISANSRIRGAVAPINVLEPLISLQQRIARQRG